MCAYSFAQFRTGCGGRFAKFAVATQDGRTGSAFGGHWRRIPPVHGRPPRCLSLCQQPVGGHQLAPNLLRIVPFPPSSCRASCPSWAARLSEAMDQPNGVRPNGDPSISRQKLPRNTLYSIRCQISAWRTYPMLLSGNQIRRSVSGDCVGVDVFEVEVLAQSGLRGHFDAAILL